LNLLNATERGTLRTKRDSAAGQINFHGRKQIDAVTVVSFGRNTSASVIGYQQFNRIQNGLSFINTATISPEGLADQTVSNASSVSTYGATFYSSSTVDVDTTQAQGNANWVVNSFSDPTDLRFEIAFTDRAQNDTAYDLFMIHRNLILFNLSYRLPTDVADTTELVALEGYSVNMTPEQTDWVFCIFRQRLITSSLRLTALLWVFWVVVALCTTSPKLSTMKTDGFMMTQMLNKAHD
jgi:hypothetical protein